MEEETREEKLIERKKIDSVIFIYYFQISLFILAY